jgi:hypothetical protein
MRKRKSSTKKSSGLMLKGLVNTRDEARPLMARPGDAVLISRGQPRSLVMVCPCGCGEHLTINLDSRSGPAWRLIKRHGKLTLYPSVWRESGCQSHFVVWQNEIYVFGRNDFDRRRHPKLENRVHEHLADGRPRHFSVIADSLGELPWAVLLACENLASDGRISELERPKSGVFARKRPQRDTNPAVQW